MSDFDERKRGTLQRESVVAFMAEDCAHLGKVEHVLRVWASIPPEGAMGVLASCRCGDEAGWSLFVQGGRLRFYYEWSKVACYDVDANDLVPVGRIVEMKLALSAEENRLGAPTRVALYVDSKPCACGWIVRQPYFRVAVLDVGVDYLSPVRRRYPPVEPGFPFTGRIHRITSEFGGAERDITPLAAPESANMVG